MNTTNSTKKIAVVPNILRDIDYIETTALIRHLAKLGNKISNIPLEILIEDIHRPALCGVCEEYKMQFCFLPRAALFENAELLISLGGDGTIIEVAVDAARYSIPIMGINLGNLGFLTQAEKSDFSLVDEFIKGHYGINKCVMLRVEILSEDDEIISSHLALNDLIISGLDHKMINASASVNGTNMGRYPADGLIVATAVGSTAYSLSAGGAVMHPEVDALIITPICPHTLKARSTVIPGGSVIELRHEPPYRSDAVVRADGKVIYRLSDNKTRVRIRKSKYTTLLVRFDGTDFFDVLRNKLSD